MVHYDEEQDAQTDMTEEYVLFSIALVSLQMVIGLLYALVRLCRWIKTAYGHLSVTAEPVVLRAKLPSPITHKVPVTTAKRSSVYFGMV